MASDVIIESFAQRLLLDSRCKTNSRFFLLSPLLQYAQSRRAHLRNRFFAPFTASKCNLLITSSGLFTNSTIGACALPRLEHRAFTFLDPYDPANEQRFSKSYRDDVLHGLHLLYLACNTRYSDEREWKSVSSIELVKKYNFPVQPSNMGSDCGVLECLYAWALAVDCPMQSISSECMSSARTFIGGFIANDPSRVFSDLCTVKPHF